MDLMDKAAALLTEELWNKGLLPCYFEREDIEKEMKYMTGCSIKVDDKYCGGYMDVMPTVHYDHVKYDRYGHMFYFAYKVYMPLEVNGYCIAPMEKYSELGIGGANEELWRIREKVSDFEYDNIWENIRAKQ